MLKSKGKFLAATGLGLWITAAASPALADVYCQAPDGSLALRAVELSTPVYSGFFLAYEAAIILKTGDDKVLLTGTVTNSPTRVGSMVSYEVSGKDGEPSELSYSTKTFVRPWNNCTRAGCDIPLQQELTATFAHNGETHELKCFEPKLQAL